MNKLILLVPFFLLGCNKVSSPQPLVDYFKNINYVQEQNNSSFDLSASNALLRQEDEKIEWASAAFPERCKWFGLERVVDGDTIIVNDDQTRIRVRMIGIDTPESKKKGTPIEPYALEASAYLKNLLVDSDEVCLVEDRVGDKLDTYGRKLSYVFTSSGQDVNADMIRSGLAEAYTYFPMERVDEFEALEVVARQAGVGRWE